MITRSYSELSQIHNFFDRFEYLRLNGVVGKNTFGYDRYLNQLLYQSDMWKQRRRDIIIRDNGCDLGCEGFDIFKKILIHHIVPITVIDILEDNPKVFDPDNLITISHYTHLAVHFGDKRLLPQPPIERIRNDTCPWKR